MENLMEHSIDKAIKSLSFGLKPELLMPCLLMLLAKTLAPPLPSPYRQQTPYPQLPPPLGPKEPDWWSVNPANNPK